MYWTLVDNFEWNFAFSLKFGLYEWNQGSQERQLRESSKVMRLWKPCNMLEPVRIPAKNLIDSFPLRNLI
jgi:beta-glucosidase/6-phospho-beta-glucosidase/beta-galactosidase